MAGPGAKGSESAGFPIPRRFHETRRINPLSKLPDHDRLERELKRVLCDNGVPAEGAVLREREKNLYTSSFPSEIVTLDLPGGDQIRLLCKYSGHLYDDVGRCMKGGLAYEAGVYRNILQPVKASAPRFYGTCTGGPNGMDWMVLELMEGGIRMDQSPDLTIHVRVSEWVARFHNAGQERLATLGRPDLYRYRADYYREWARRTVRFAVPALHQRHPWLIELCRRFEALAEELETVGPVIVHGEFYPCNILIQNGRVRPVDWESCAVAPGEIDLATLSDGWPLEKVSEMEEIYRQTRWVSSGSPAHTALLDLARCYVHFRWLGNRPEWTLDEQRAWRYEDLKGLGERLNLI